MGPGACLARGRHHLDTPATGGLVPLVRRLSGVHALPGPFRNRVSRTGGWISPVLLDGGRIVGTWAQEAGGDRPEVAVSPVGRLRPAVRDAAETEAGRWASYAGAPLSLSWESPG